MKVNMCGYEVSISAKHPWMDKATKKSTLQLLNYISIILDEASENYKKEGYSAKTTERYADELYIICKDNGLYKN